MLQQRYTTVLRYRLIDKEPDAEDAPNHLSPRVASNNSADRGNGKDQLPQSASLTGEGAREEEQVDEGEAGIPQPFDYFETEKGQVSSSKVQHNSHPLPQFYGFGEVPPDLTKLHPLKYYPLNPEVYPVRLLVVLPHFGDPYSTVQCNLFVLSFLSHHYCYAAIRNTRGNKTLTSNIIINCEVKQVTRNLEVFLHHCRDERVAKIIWIREICIYPDDNPCHKTPEWRDWIFNRACKVLDMPDFMEKLQNDGALGKKKQVTVRQKDWTKVVRDMKLPTHYPIPLQEEALQICTF